MQNPYAPPSDVISSHSGEGMPSEPIRLELMMTSEYVIEAVDRTRSRDPVRKLWMLARWPVSGLLLIVSVMLAATAPALYAFCFAAFVFSSFFAYRVDDWYYLWSLKRTGWLDAKVEITISETGYRTQTQGFDLTVPWNSFNAADIFEDGILLFQTKKSSPWIPWSVLSSSDDQTRLMDFVRRKFADRHRVHRRRPLAR